MGEQLDKDSHLRAVRTKTPYSSVEEYMETYFRLHRVECFSSIQKVKKVHRVLYISRYRYVKTGILAV
jgi:hypothetical protein